MRARSRLPLLLLAILVRHALGDAQCFGVSGQKSSGTPCNAGATGSAGSHSSCCDASKQEACLSTGLCYASQRSDNNTFWSEGCTDPQGLDPMCPQYCGTTSQFIQSTEESQPLPPKTTLLTHHPPPKLPSRRPTPCSSAAAAAGAAASRASASNARAPTAAAATSRSPAGLGSVVRQFGANDLSSSSPSSASPLGSGSGGGGPNNPNRQNSPLIAAIVGGVLGSLLLASVVAFGFSHSRNRQLRRQVEALQNENRRTATDMMVLQRAGTLVKGAEELVSPVSYEQLRTMSTSRGGGGGRTPSTTSGGPGGGGFVFPSPPDPASTPSWSRTQGSVRRGGTAELPGPASVSELPAEKYLG